MINIFLPARSLHGPRNSAKITWGICKDFLVVAHQILNNLYPFLLIIFPTCLIKFEYISTSATTFWTASCSSGKDPLNRLSQILRKMLLWQIKSGSWCLYFWPSNLLSFLFLFVCDLYLPHLHRLSHCQKSSFLLCRSSLCKGWRFEPARWHLWIFFGHFIINLSSIVLNVCHKTITKCSSNLISDHNHHLVLPQTYKSQDS